MSMPSNAVLVDNDFICHLSESKLRVEDICNAVITVMNILGKQASIHTLVKQHELDISAQASKIGLINSLISQKILTEVMFFDIFDEDEDNGKQAYYDLLVQDFYYAQNKESMSLNPGETVTTYWKSQKSLGEIHSLATCIICDCGIFLSDDKDSKKLADYINHKYMGNITIYNRHELFDLEPISNELSRFIRRSLSHK